MPPLSNSTAFSSSSDDDVGRPVGFVRVGVGVGAGVGKGEDPPEDSGAHAPVLLLPISDPNPPLRPVVRRPG